MTTYVTQTPDELVSQLITQGVRVNGSYLNDERAEDQS
jgi:hypothetical protein